MESTTTVAEKHARAAIWTSADPLLQGPTTDVVAIRLLDGTQVVVTLFNATTGVATMFSPDVVTESAVLDAARTIADWKGLACLERELSGK